MRAFQRPGSVVPIGSKRQSYNLLVLSSGCFVSACAAVQSTPPVPKVLQMTPAEMIAIQSRVTDCEWKAAGRYDDGRRSLSELTQR